MAANVVPLPPERRSALIDESTVEALQEAIGPAACAEIIQDALIQVAAGLAGLERATEIRDLPLMGRIAHDLVSVPGQIGMLEVSNLASALEQCCLAEDEVSACAVSARVLWVGEESLVAYQSMSTT